MSICNSAILWNADTSNVLVSPMSGKEMCFKAPPKTFRLDSRMAKRIRQWVPNRRISDWESAGNQGHGSTVSSPKGFGVEPELNLDLVYFWPPKSGCWREFVCLDVKSGTAFNTRSCTTANISMAVYVTYFLQFNYHERLTNIVNIAW